jgi:hypothetical protein
MAQAVVNLYNKQNIQLYQSLLKDIFFKEFITGCG